LKFGCLAKARRDNLLEEKHDNMEVVSVPSYVEMVGVEGQYASSNSQDNVPQRQCLVKKRRTGRHVYACVYAYVEHVGSMSNPQMLMLALSMRPPEPDHPPRMPIGFCTVAMGRKRKRPIAATIAVYGHRPLTPSEIAHYEAAVDARGVVSAPQPSAPTTPTASSSSDKASTASSSSGVADDSGNKALTAASSSGVADDSGKASTAASSMPCRCPRCVAKCPRCLARCFNDPEEVARRSRRSATEEVEDPIAEKEVEEAIAEHGRLSAWFASRRIQASWRLDWVRERNMRDWRLDEERERNNLVMSD
jgi:hypothetical protein